MEHDGATITELVDFTVNAFPTYNGEYRKVEKIIKDVLKYNTGDYGIDEKGIVYILRWNISEDCSTANVIDLFIREDYRGSTSFIKYIISRGWSKFPYLKYVVFGRYLKYPCRDERKYRLIKFFNRGRHHGGKDRDSTEYATASTDGSAKCS